MGIEAKSVSDDVNELSDRFNKRDSAAVSQVYLLFFDEINYFAAKLFAGSAIDSFDLVQDIFVTLCTHEKMVFRSMEHIRNYLYLCVKNKFKDHLKHAVATNRYQSETLYAEKMAQGYQIETEVISLLSMAEKVLPAECTRLLKLYMEGFDIKEIAQKLGKSQFTVYHQHRDMINILRKYFSRDDLQIFLQIFTSL